MSALPQLAIGPTPPEPTFTLTTTPAPERRHEDVFTEEEAGAYLHLPPDRSATILETLRARHGLLSTQFGRITMYHRKNLDNLVLHMFHLEQMGRRR